MRLRISLCVQRIGTTVTFPFHKMIKTAYTATAIYCSRLLSQRIVHQTSWRNCSATFSLSVCFALLVFQPLTCLSVRVPSYVTHIISLLVTLCVLRFTAVSSLQLQAHSWGIFTLAFHMVHGVVCTLHALVTGSGSTLKRGNPHSITDPRWRHLVYAQTKQQHMDRLDKDDSGAILKGKYTFHRWSPTRWRHSVYAQTKQQHVDRLDKDDWYRTQQWLHSERENHIPSLIPKTSPEKNSELCPSWKE